MSDPYDFDDAPKARFPSLVELLIVVVIIGILAAIAIPKLRAQEKEPPSVVVALVDSISKLEPPEVTERYRNR